MPTGNQSRRQIAKQRELNAWTLRGKGWTEARIAAELQITQQAVSHILKRVSKRVEQQADDIVRQIKSDQSAILEYLIDEAVQAWERSKDPAKSITKRGGDGGAGGGVTQVLKDQDGDPRYTAEVRAAMADLRKIWGADAATKTDITSGGKAVTFRVIYDDEPDSGIPDTSTEAA